MAQNAYEYDTKTGKRAKRRSRIDRRTTRHPGYAVSQVIRKIIETLFGDGKQHGGTIRQVKLRGQRKVSDVFTLAMLAVNLRRLPALLARQAIMTGSGYTGKVRSFARFDPQFRRIRCKRKRKPTTSHSSYPLPLQKIHRDQ